MNWLRAKMHLFPLVFLGLAMVVLGINWMITENSPNDTLATAILGAGAGVLFVLKLNLVRKSKSDD